MNSNRNHIVNNIFAITNFHQFKTLAIEVFQYQFQHNWVYQNWCLRLGVNPKQIQQIQEIPFLPIQFFKTHKIQSGEWLATQIFESSGTTQMQSSKHYVNDLSIYEKSFLNAFEQFFGKPEQFCIVGLLPHYLEKGNSSLVYMVNQLMQVSGHPLNGFYLNDFEQLHETLLKLESQKQPTLLFGVTYALLDFVNLYPIKLDSVAIVETGGMKGRKREVLREKLHKILRNATGCKRIFSEYGMTELFAQAYALREEEFNFPNWAKALVRDESDPLNVQLSGKGVLNVIDLSNIDTCSFIATDDVVALAPEGNFKILGRLDQSEMRGCSLLYLA